jgi:tetratricopeptide (TPR) repeat protein
MPGISVLLLLGAFLNFFVSGSNAFNIILLVVSGIVLLINLPFIKKMAAGKGAGGRILLIISSVLVIIYIFAGVFFNPYKEDSEIASKYDRGMKYLANEEFEKALKEFTEIEEKYPQDYQTLLAKGILYMSMENYNDSWNYLGKAYAVNPYDLNILYNMALNRYHAGQKTDSLKRFESICKLTPEVFRARLYAGIISMELGNHPKAIYHLGEAVKLNPDSVEANYYLGESHYEIMGYREAQHYFENAIKLKPVKELETVIKEALNETLKYTGGGYDA